MKQITIKQIQPNTDEYQQELLLRDRILRKPLNLNLSDEDLSAEVHDIHIGAFDSDVLVGVLILTIINDTAVKMRQVAVDNSCQSRGIGTKMVTFAEQFALLQEYTHIKLNARKKAVEFYKKLGYNTVGDEFVEVGIPHFAMSKTLI